MSWLASCPYAIVQCTLVKGGVNTKCHALKNVCSAVVEKWLYANTMVAFLAYSGVHGTTFGKKHRSVEQIMPEKLEVTLMCGDVVGLSSSYFSWQLRCSTCLDNLWNITTILYLIQCLFNMKIW